MKSNIKILSKKIAIYYNAHIQNKVFPSFSTTTPHVIEMEEFLTEARSS